MFLKIPFEDSLYPESVKNLKNPPKELFVLCDDDLGKNFSWPKKSLAVVGSRNMSSYGRKVVWDFVPRLVKAGVAIVSGLAEGVDQEAQKAVLVSNGVTIGVLGFGIYKLDQFSNRELGRQIVLSKKGFLVSNFEPYLSASGWTFLERNRLISAIADSILVVEATQKSGCFTTAEAALELGKDVYAVPGSIFNYASMGTNELIKQGAHLVNCVEDLIS